MKEKASTLHLLSGGIDSTVLLYKLVAEKQCVDCILFNYGQRQIQELDCARYHCRKLSVLYVLEQLPYLRSFLHSPVIPARNAVMLATAAHHAVLSGYTHISYACNQEDAGLFEDCKWEFVSSFNKMLLNSGVGAQVIAPFIGLSKKQIVAIGNKLGVDFIWTWSCYRGGNKHCRKCRACKARFNALK